MPKAPLLMVGLLAICAPHRKIKSMIGDIKEPKTFTMTVNGAMELEHWLIPRGGRVVGEVCHFIDL